ncbi:predicted protein, partial [Nematostella vectensis]
MADSIENNDQLLRTNNSQPDVPNRPTRFQRIRQLALKNFLPLGLVFLVGFGILLPAPGVFLSEFPTHYICIVGIFLHSGLKLRTGEIRDTIRAYKALIYQILVIMLLTPIIGVKLTELLPFGREALLSSRSSSTNDGINRTSKMGMNESGRTSQENAVLGPAEFKTGIELYLIVPCTISAGVVLVSQAGGNATLALVTTIVCNLMAVFTLPVMMKWLMSFEGVKLDAINLLVKLLLTVLLPLVNLRYLLEWYLPPQNLRYLLEWYLPPQNLRYLLEWYLPPQNLRYLLVSLSGTFLHRTLGISLSGTFLHRTLGISLSGTFLHRTLGIFLEWYLPPQNLRYLLEWYLPPQNLRYLLEWYLPPQNLRPLGISLFLEWYLPPQNLRYLLEWYLPPQNLRPNPTLFTQGLTMHYQFVQVGKGLRYIPKVKSFVKRFTNCLKLLSVALLIMIPWMKVSNSSDQGAFNSLYIPSVFAILTWGVSLHVVFMGFNLVVSLVLKFDPPTCKCIVILASQKSLVVMVTVLSLLPFSSAAQGLMALPAIIIHLGVLVLDAFVVTWWHNRDERRKKEQNDIVLETLEQKEEPLDQQAVLYESH